MFEGFNKKLCDFTECDLLALSMLVTREIAKIIDDVDTLSLVADLVTSIGDNLTLLAGQRERCQAAKDVEAPSLNEQADNSEHNQDNTTNPSKVTGSSSGDKASKEFAGSEQKDIGDK